MLSLIVESISRIYNIIKLEEGYPDILSCNIFQRKITLKNGWVMFCLRQPFSLISRVCGSALQCISCRPKDVISWNLDEPDSSVWDIMPWKASKLPEIGKRKTDKKNKWENRENLKTRQTRTFPCPRCPCGRPVKIVLAESPSCTHSPSPDMSLSKSWWVIGSYLWQSINGTRVL